jgi:hypothetical protein
MVSLLAGGGKQRSTRRTSGSSATRDSVVTHLTQGWIPVNPHILKKVQQLLQEQPDNRHAILDLVSQDISLSLYLNAELYRVSGTAQLVSPEERILNVSLAEFKEILPKSALQISKHSYSRMSLSQSGQLQRTLVATKAATALAQTAGKQIHDVNFGVLFSDLGRQLIAWNYPLVYNRALSIQRSGAGELDREISRILGINPNQVLSGLALRYGVPQAIQNVFNERADMRQFNQEVTLSDIINYGRLFGERLDAKNFTCAERKFEELEDQLSKKVVSLPDHLEIEARSEESLSQYKEVVTQRFRFAVGAWKSAEQQTKPYILDGRHFPVPGLIRDQVQAIFERIQHENDKLLALSALIDTIIPLARFSSGCIYVLSDNQEQLLPQMQIGRSSNRWQQGIALNSDHDLIRAFFSNVALKQLVETAEGQRQFCYSAGLQSINFDGVLVLCANVEDIGTDQESEQFNCFRTILSLFELIFQEGTNL